MPQNTGDMVFLIPETWKSVAMTANQHILHMVLSLLTQMVWSWLARWWPMPLLKLKVRTELVLAPKKYWMFFL